MSQVEIGKRNRLRVLKEVEQGFYLQGDEEWGEILLPKKLAQPGITIDAELDVFIYFDSEDRIVATQETPLATVGEFVTLKVSSVTDFGTFLEWGLSKDLFVPLREQLFKMTQGHSYPVYIYIDKSERIAASTRLSQFVDKSKPDYSVGDPVELLLFHKTDMGIKAIVDGKYAGLLYESDLRGDLKLGQRIQGYVSKIREDNKIDLSLQPPGLRGRKELSEQIIDKLIEAGGSLNVTSKTPANTISEMFGVSRKKFKMALGLLYKQQRIEVSDDKITLIK